MIADGCKDGLPAKLAVYVLEHDTLVEVACNDDVSADGRFSLQASLTLETELGVTYYVQAGGYGESQFGRLRLGTR